MIDSLGPGGSQRVLTWMADRWVHQGDEVSLLTYVGEEDFFPLDRKVHRIKLSTGRTQPSGARRLVTNIGRVVKLRRSLKSQRPDAVISFIHRTNVSTLLATLGLGIPVVVSERIDPSQEPLPPIWAKLRAFTYPKAAVVVVQTHSAARWLDEACPRTDIVILPNPLPSVAEAERWRPDTAEPLVLGVGRLHRQKGFDVLLRAFQVCAQQHPDWRLEILGEGDIRPELEELATKLGLSDRVSMQGAVPDVLKRLQRAAIFVLSSNFEGFPNALLEAVAVGVPTISTSCRSGPDEIIDHMKNGVLVPVGDVTLMASAMAALMDDRALRATLASNTAEIVTRLEEERVFRQWDELVRGLIK